MMLLMTPHHDRAPKFAGRPRGSGPRSIFVIFGWTVALIISLGFGSLWSRLDEDALDRWLASSILLLGAIMTVVRAQSVLKDLGRLQRDDEDLPEHVIE